MYKLLKLMNADGGDGGGTATLEAPAATSAAPKMGIDSLRQQLSQPPAPEVPVAKAAAKAPVAPAVEKAAPPVNDPATSKTSATSAAPEPSEIEVFEKGLSKGSQQRFRELAGKLAKSEAEKLVEERIKTIKPLTPELETEFETTKKQRDEYLTKLREVDVFNDPVYKQKFVERPAAIKQSLGEIAKTYEISEAALFKAIDGGRATRGELNTLLESVGVIDRAQAASEILELQAIEQDRAKVASDFEASKKVLNETREGQIKAYVEKLVSDRKEAFTKQTLPAIEKEASEIGLFDGEEGTALKSQIFESAGKLNEQDLERMSHTDRAALITSAFLSKPLANQVKTLKARVAELESKLADEDAGTPTIGGGRPPGTPPPEKPKSFMERLRAGEV